MKEVKLRTVEELTLSQQASLVAGAGNAEACNCGECTGCTKEQGNKQTKHLTKWGGPMRKKNS